MAKNIIRLADLIVRLNDDGSIAGFEKKTKKAGKAVDNLSKSEATLNRNFKGASQQSSNQTKNFSKMAQGITGGLVPAYATLAANIFAIGAAFRFLQSAADFRILTEGQSEYAQRTGQNLAIMTRQLQAATDGQLAFADAAQSVAIGTAAGLSIKQINELGVVAKNASLMLGRDLTDSFNRLVRGAVKAEPELLDELGIILRLETASEKYALSIGKTKDQLNIFEKSQAVVNEVLEQGLDKFGGVETQTNSLTKLAKSFDDLVNSLKRAIGPMAEFMAISMSQNTAAVAGAGFALGGGIARSLIPKVPDFDFQAAGQTARDRFGSIYSGSRDLQSLDRKGVDALIRDTKRAYKKNSSTVIAFERMKRSEALNSLKAIRISILQEENARSGMLTRSINNYRLMVEQFKVQNNTLVAHVKATGTAIATGFSKLLRLVSFAGIFVTLTSMAGQYFDRSSKAEKQARAAQAEFGRIFSQNAEDLEKMVSNMKTFDSLLTNSLQSARALSNIDYGQALAGISGGFGGKNFAVPAVEGGKKPGGFGTFMANLIGGGSQLINNIAGKEVLKAEFIETLSKNQIKGIEGVRDALAAETTLLIKGSAAYQEHNMGIALMNQLLKDPESEFARKQVELYLTHIKDNGTIAGNAMKGLGQTTQIMTSSAQDFNKALNSFKTPQTQLTRLTTNIKSVGEAMEGVAEAFAKGQVQMKMNSKTGTLFDKGTVDMLKTFLGEDEMKILANDESGLRALAQMLEKAKEEGDVEKIDIFQRALTARGAALFEKYGGMVTEEAKRLHGIEMTMIRGKLQIETELINATMGQSKMLSKQIQKQSTVTKLKREAFDLELLIAELNKKEINKDHAQIALETERLANVKAKIEKAKMEASALHQVQQAFRDSFESSMATAFQSIIEGTSNMKDAFLSMTKSILSAMAQVLAQQAAIAIMGSIPFFPGLGPKGRDGGIMKSPGYRSYREGDIARGPESGYTATLHGTEAVVPLPNGRSIPVEMTGGMGGNNISVNVNMTTGETSSTGGGEEAYALGRAISTAVQTELEKQQRPGGALSPY